MPSAVRPLLLRDAAGSYPNVSEREASSVKIDIDSLTEVELIDLNHRIVARLRLLQQMRTHTSMLQFSIGERVCFQPDGRPPVFGILTKYNKKSVTVITEDGEHWNVAPSLLQKASGRFGASSDRTVIRLPKKR
jgi:hypothetical protein